MNDFQSDYFEDLQSTADWEAFEENGWDESNSCCPSDPFSQAELILGFIERTPELTESEQAELLGAFVEDTMHSGEVDWNRFARGLQTGLSLLQTGTQVAGGIAGALGRNNSTAQNIARWSRQLGQGAGFAQNLMGTIRPGQAPRLPTGVQQVAQAGLPYLQRIATQMAQAGGRSPAGAGTAVQPGAPGRTPLNNTAQFASLLNNPQLMQVLRSTLFRGREGAMNIEADISGGMPVEIPMGEVMATIARLAHESALELDALAGENAAGIPDYLIAEDGEYIVDPGCTEDRTALVLANLRHQGERDRYNEQAEGVEFEGSAGYEMDESEAWARETGFDDALNTRY